MLSLPSMRSENWLIPGWPWVSWTMFGMMDSLQMVPALFKMSWSSTEIFTRSFIKGFLIEVRQREISVDTQNICVTARSQFQWDLLNHFTAFFWRSKFFLNLKQRKGINKLCPEFLLFIFSSGRLLSLGLRANDVEILPQLKDSTTVSSKIYSLTRMLFYDVISNCSTFRLF